MCSDMIDVILETSKALQGFVVIEEPPITKTTNTAEQYSSISRGHSESSNSNQKAHTNISRQSSGNSTKRSSSKNSNNNDMIENDLINTLKNIFPDYGRAFLLACLKVCSHISYNTVVYFYNHNTVYMIAYFYLIN